jgi:hypothetical protein
MSAVPRSTLQRPPTIPPTTVLAEQCRPKRKQTYSIRTRTGCTTCRSRKKKCDEAKPKCNNCTRAGFLCEGYAERSVWQRGGTNALLASAPLPATQEPSSTTSGSSIAIHGPSPATDAASRAPQRISTGKRSKTGCMTCRRHKKKCDEAKPECNRCIIWCFQCEGYGERSVPAPNEPSQAIHRLSPATYGPPQATHTPPTLALSLAIHKPLFEIPEPLLAECPRSVSFPLPAHNIEGYSKFQVREGVNILNP